MTTAVVIGGGSGIGAAVSSFWVVVHPFPNSVDQLNDPLRHIVSGCGFASKQDGARCVVDFDICFESVVQINGVESAQQLAFVFVNAFDLYIKQGFWIQADLQTV